jgi:hypothetical protein
MIAWVRIPAEVWRGPGCGDVVVSAEQRTELMNLARSRTEETRLVERARIILACLDGKRNDEVSRELGVRPNTVGLWRQRFAARCLKSPRSRQMS